jgi:hypothetical protein
MRQGTKGAEAEAGGGGLSSLPGAFLPESIAPSWARSSFEKSHAYGVSDCLFDLSTGSGHYRLESTG